MSLPTNAQEKARYAQMIEATNSELSSMMQALSQKRIDLDHVSDSDLIDFADAIVQTRKTLARYTQNYRFYAKQSENAPDEIIEIPF